MDDTTAKYLPSEKSVQNEKSILYQGIFFEIIGMTTEIEHILNQLSNLTSLQFLKLLTHWSSRLSMVEKKVSANFSCSHTPFLKNILTEIQKTLQNIDNMIVLVKGGGIFSKNRNKVKANLLIWIKRLDAIAGKLEVFRQI